MLDEFKHVIEELTVITLKEKYDIKDMRRNPLDYSLLRRWVIYISLRLHKIRKVLACFVLVIRVDKPFRLAIVDRLP